MDGDENEVYRPFWVVERLRSYFNENRLLLRDVRKFVRVCPPDETLEKVYAAAYSHLLYLQGVIKEEENLVHMIQKNRLKKSKKVSNATQASA